MDTEAVILTGGFSLRMGQDKARIIVQGKTIGERISSEFESMGVSVTVLGSESIPGRATIMDAGEGLGPARALSGFKPSARSVFVCSCDIPLFSSRCVPALVAELDSHEAAIPVIQGRQQYLCAAYRDSVFAEWKELVETGGARSMKELVRVLDSAYIDDGKLVGLGLDPRWMTGVNTEEELCTLLGDPR